MLCKDIFAVEKSMSENDEPACESCQVDVAVGILDKLCNENKTKKVCDISLNKLLTGQISIKEYTTEIKKTLNDKPAVLSTIKEVEKAIDEWHIADETVEAEYE